MALTNASLFLYGLQVTVDNQNISFGTSAGETPGLNTARTATLQVGFYSLSGLAQEVARAMTAADPTHRYTVSVERNVMSGTENRVTITTNFTYLSIYFNTGNPSNPALLLGFPANDFTGATTYTGSSTCGTAFIPNQIGYNYLPAIAMQKNFGTQNISASGLKETIVFALQSFWQVQFKYIPTTGLTTDWNPLVQWMIQQRELEFTPDITDPDTFYAGTLENPSQGLQFNFTEHLPDFPQEYFTPVMQFRVRS